MIPSLFEKWQASSRSGSCQSAGLCRCHGFTSWLQGCHDIVDWMLETDRLLKAIRHCLKIQPFFFLNKMSPSCQLGSVALGEAFDGCSRCLHFCKSLLIISEVSFLTSNFKVAMTRFFFSFLDLEARNFISFQVLHVHLFLFAHYAGLHVQRHPYVDG